MREKFGMKVFRELELELARMERQRKINWTYEQDVLAKHFFSPYWVSHLFGEKSLDIGTYLATNTNSTAS